MATSPSAVSGLPAGYTEEAPQGQSSGPVEGLPEGYQLETAGGTGSITNDVGNQVIVPKEGESFDDTMKRAAAHGQTVTQADINKEVPTIPKKAAQVLLAAPAIGFGGAAALAGLGEGTAALKHIATTYGPQAAKAIGDAAEAHPIVAKLLTHALETAGGLSLIKLYKLFE